MGRPCRLCAGSSGGSRFWTRAAQRHKGTRSPCGRDPTAVRLGAGEGPEGERVRVGGGLSRATGRQPAPHKERPPTVGRSLQQRSRSGGPVGRSGVWGPLPEGGFPRAPRPPSKKPLLKRGSGSVEHIRGHWPNWGQCWWLRPGTHSPTNCASKPEAGGQEQGLLFRLQLVVGPGVPSSRARVAGRGAGALLTPVARPSPGGGGAETGPRAACPRRASSRPLGRRRFPLRLPHSVRPVQRRRATGSQQPCDKRSQPDAGLRA